MPAAGVLARLTTMNHSALTPVFTAMRVGLHVLVIGLTLFVLLRASIAVAETGAWSKPGAIIALGCLFLVTYAVGGPALRQSRRRAPRWLWLTALGIEWLGMACLTPDAAFLVFPLFFLFLHLIAWPWNVLAVAVSTAGAIVLLALHTGWSIGGVLGPVIGAAVSVVIGLGYAALFREAHEREALIADLIATRTQLAATEREAGILAERARLAREIHDTVAQGLSSIQLLLHAVERADATHPAIEHVRLARETAATNLAETRRFIRELTPPALQEQSIEGALQRLAATTAQASGLSVNLRVSGDSVTLPMTVETALLRVAQGSLANVVQHAEASQAELTLSYMVDAVSLDIVDDGRGFTPRTAGHTRGEHQESFGLEAMRGRVAQLGGAAVVESSPGNGTAVAVSFPLAAAPAAPQTIPEGGTS
ncbi:histidine kinase [Leifsonia sp. Root112D2]|jgi:signal transduction histidine kinase|nr:histidine kinase [Leifsonia sp. Root112D2]